MYFIREHNVLVVDDDTDVLGVTLLALRDLKVYDVPLRLHLAESKAEAIHLMETDLATQLPGFSIASVAFIDVVMESEHAGLELCHYMRETMGNQFTQLYVRTGQPGVAPERAVIDRYDINGYLAKPEATRDKLYTLVKSGVREYTLLTYAILQAAYLEGIIAAGHSRAGITQTLQMMTAGASTDASGKPIEQLDIRGGDRHRRRDRRRSVARRHGRGDRAVRRAATTARSTAQSRRGHALRGRPR